MEIVKEEWSMKNDAIKQIKCREKEKKERSRGEEDMVMIQLRVVQGHFR